MAINLKLSYGNSCPSSSPGSAEGCFINSTLHSEYLKVHQFNARKLVDKIPKRKLNSRTHAKLRESNAKLSEKDMGIDEINICTQSSDDDCKNLIDFLGFCCREERLDLGEIIHSLAVKSGLIEDKYLITSLVNMYSKCGKIDSARALFDHHMLLQPDIAACNCLISGYSNNKLLKKAFDFFIEIDNLGMNPNHYTYSILLSKCGIKEGKQLHARVLKTQFITQRVVFNSLLTMYTKFGTMEEAETLFLSSADRNVVSWTAIISGFVQKKAFETALRQVHYMRQNGLEPNESTYTVVLAACADMKRLNNGRSFHGQVFKNGMASGVYVGTAVIDMYAELGEMEEAVKQIHDMGKIASNVSRNAVISGFVRHGNYEEAMEVFSEMVNDNIQCNEFTYSIVLKACSSLPSLSMCKQVHSRIIKAKFEVNLHVGSSLIEAYAKCGTLDDAEQVFNQISVLDLILWNSMIKAYSQHGFSAKSHFLFKEMVKNGMKPSGSTFLAVLSGFSHSGLVQDGKKFFESMVRDYRIIPEETHYSCMVDLLGRSGQLKKAVDYIKKLPIKPTAPILRPLLAACKIHKNLDLAESVAKNILELDHKDPTIYITLSNMYAEVGRYIDAEKQRTLMESKGISKEPGCSWIEVKNRIYKFYSGDKRESKFLEPYKKLKQSEIALYHSEKLAVGFGLLNLPAGIPIRVFKNLRVCLDCHSTMKYVSKFTDREIVLKDNYRFHHFKNGICSCKDFW